MVQLNGGFDDCDYVSDAAIGSTPSREMSDVPPFHSIGDAKGSMPGQSKSEDDIAVVGIALKFPGDATSTESFWKMLMDRRSALSDVPQDRYNIDAFWSPDALDPGTSNARGAHFVREDIAAFDAPFFSISPAEAECMDPQQRWLLETTYHALENAGLPLDRVAATETSVHVGSFGHDYGVMLSRDPGSQAQHRATGTSSAMLANRISWFYDFKGPSISIDTACSSSLNALDSACQGIRNGQSTMGVVAGSNIISGPETSAALADLGFLSPDSKCYSFDHRANGYSRGEGIAVVIIKSVIRAVEDGNTIRAVIRASRSNQDGRTPGVSQPSSVAHETLIRQTYTSAGLDMALTNFFEAHGTGTRVGDPIEALGIYQAFKDRPKRHALRIGAVKTNVGHLEGAAGLAGFIKTVLVLEKGVIPPNALFEKPNDSIDTAGWNLEFPVEPILWPTDGLRRASVSSFGFGGSNCHVVLDDARSYLHLHGLRGKHCTLPRRSEPDKLLDQHRPSSPHVAKSSSPFLLVWSAQDEKSLQRVYRAYEVHINSIEPLEDEVGFLASMCYTLAAKRTLMPWRASLTVDSTAQLKRDLNHAFATPRRSIQNPGIAFVFTGQGAEWAGMGLELLNYATFRNSLNLSQTILSDLGCTWELLDEMALNVEITNLRHPAYSQPICTALQIALITLLCDWGVKPDRVFGHSSGEIAAAYCTGAISHESALKIAFYRGLSASSLLQESHSPGAMMAVGLGEDEVLPYLHKTADGDTGDRLCVACINSSRNTTVSGPEVLIRALQTLLASDGVFHRRLDVSVAYHSTAMQEVAAKYASSINGISPGSREYGNPCMVSSLTGHECSFEELRDPAYWARNITSPVRFSSALRHIGSSHSKKLDDRKSQKIDVICEIGPHGVLKGAIKDNLKDINLKHRVDYTSLLTKGLSATNTMMEAAGLLHCAGGPIDVPKTNAATPALEMLVDLPAYPFDHTKQYWSEGRLSKNTRFRKMPPHELLGTAVSDWNRYEARWTNNLGVTQSPWVKHHKINDTLLYPAAGFIIMAIEAARTAAAAGKGIIKYHLRDVIFGKAAVLPMNGSVEVQITLRKSDEASRTFLEWCDFRIYLFQGQDSTEAGRGSIALEYMTDDPVGTESASNDDHLKVRAMGSLEALTNCKLIVSSKQFYDTLKNSGLAFGPTFRGLKAIRYDGQGTAVACVDANAWTSKLPDNVQPNIIHPGSLDATLLQAILVVLTKGGRRRMPTMVPTSIVRLQISADLYDCKETAVDVSARREFEGSRSADFSTLASSSVDGRILLYCRLKAQTVAETGLSSSQIRAAPKQLCYSVEWKPDLGLMTRKQIQSYSSAWSSQSVDHSQLMIPEKDVLCCLAFERIKNNIDEKTIRKRSPHLGRYLDWMNNLIRSSDLCSEARPFIEGLSFDALERQVGKNDPAGQLIVRVTQNLQKILEGEVDALGLLFQDSLTNDYYRFFNKICTGFRDLGLYIDLSAHKHPNLNILEIGAGTGSATRDILCILTQGGTKRFAEYTFTDLSASFFAKAREDFRDCADRMSFLPLNIEEDPLQQGFSAKYDIVVASNVLHATSSLRSTLKNARKLLRRDGRIIIFESTNPQSITAPFVFGLLPGWWQGTEDFRQWGPLVNEDTWNSLLQETGFSGVDVSFRNSLSNGRDSSSVLISSALDEPIRVVRCSRVVILETEYSDSPLSAAPSTALAEDLRSVLVTECAINDVQIWKGLTAWSEVPKDAIFILLSHEHDTVLTRVSAIEYENLQKLVKAASGLLWVFASDQGPSGADPVPETVTGFLRCMQSENEGLKVASLCIPSTVSSATAVVQHIRGIFERTFMSSKISDADSEYLVESSLIQIPRVVQAKHLNGFVHSKVTTGKAMPRPFGETAGRCLKLEMANPGLLESFQFIDDETAQEEIAFDEIEVEVRATGVNFLDVLIALGRVSSNHIGRDCAGIVTQVGSNSSFEIGDHVVCTTVGAYQTRARVKAAAACRMPDSMPFTTAAALPTPFLTAYYALVEVARIRPQESVLIHSAAGGTGQACVQIAQLYGAEIYATVGSDEKRALLREWYGITDDHIFSSRSTVFVSGIGVMTKGRGVDVVINSLAGEALRSTWEDCLAPLGRFIEIGKKDIMSLGQLPMATFAKNVSFASVDLMLHLREMPTFVGEMLSRVVQLWVEEKISVQKPLEIFDAPRIEEAFRLMQSGRNKGKMVITFGPQDLVPTVPSKLPTYRFDHNATYLIVGGLGGLGRSIARWMVSRNARHLILLGSSNPIREAGTVLVEELQAQGVNVATPSCNVSDRAALERTLNHCLETMPSIKGCVQGAMVLKDEAFTTMSHSNFHTVLQPKVQGSWNLHSLLPSNLDFFILLSSYAGIIGSYGQTNYAAGNTYQDALAHHRVAHGHKGISIDLANVRSVGYIAERDDLAAALRTEDYMGIEEAELLALMEYSCDPTLALTPENCQIITGLDTAARLRRRKITEPLYMNRPLFSQLYALDDDEAGAGRHASSSSSAPNDDQSAGGNNEPNYGHLLSSAGDDIDEAGRIVADGLARKIGAMMELDVQDMDTAQPLHSFGVDSLAAIEIRTWFARTMKADVAIFDIISSNVGIEELGRLAAGKSEFVRGAEEGGEGGGGRGGGGGGGGGGKGDV